MAGQRARRSSRSLNGRCSPSGAATVGAESAAAAATGGATGRFAVTGGTTGGTTGGATGGVAGRFVVTGGVLARVDAPPLACGAGTAIAPRGACSLLGGGVAGPAIASTTASSSGSCP